MTANRKGKDGERAVASWLKAQGFPRAERRLSGAGNDKGDITGIPGVVIEAKVRRTLALAEWVDQLTEEMDNADADIGAIVAKRRGKSDVAEWYAIMPASVFASLLRQAGWGDPDYREDP